MANAYTIEQVRNIILGTKFFFTKEELAGVRNAFLEANPTKILNSINTLYGTLEKPENAARKLAFSTHQKLLMEEYIALIGDGAKRESFINHVIAIYKDYNDVTAKMAAFKKIFLDDDNTNGTFAEAKSEKVKKQLNEANQLFTPAYNAFHNGEYDEFKVTFDTFINDLGDRALGELKTADADLHSYILDLRDDPELLDTFMDNLILFSSKGADYNLLAADDMPVDGDQKIDIVDGDGANDNDDGNDGNGNDTGNDGDGNDGGQDPNDPSYIKDKIREILNDQINEYVKGEGEEYDRLREFIRGIGNEQLDKVIGDVGQIIGGDNLKIVETVVQTVVAGRTFEHRFEDIDDALKRVGFKDKTERKNFILYLTKYFEADKDTILQGAVNYAKENEEKFGAETVTKFEEYIEKNGDKFTNQIKDLSTATNNFKGVDGVTRDALRGVALNMVDQGLLALFKRIGLIKKEEATTLLDGLLYESPKNGWEKTFNAVVTFLYYVGSIGLTYLVDSLLDRTIEKPFMTVAPMGQTFKNGKDLGPQIPFKSKNEKNDVRMTTEALNILQKITESRGRRITYDFKDKNKKLLGYNQEGNTIKFRIVKTSAHRRNPVKTYTNVTANLNNGKINITEKQSRNRQVIGKRIVGVRIGTNSTKIYADKFNMQTIQVEKDFNALGEQLTAHNVLHKLPANQIVKVNFTNTDTIYVKENGNYIRAYENLKGQTLETTVKSLLSDKYFIRGNSGISIVATNKKLTNTITKYKRFSTQNAVANISWHANKKVDVLILPKDTKFASKQDYLDQLENNGVTMTVNQLQKQKLGQGMAAFVRHKQLIFKRDHTDIGGFKQVVLGFAQRSSKL